MRAACITTLNEAQTIGRLVRELLDRGVHCVYVTDNGSIDGTADIAERKGANVQRLGRPIGIGPALTAAWLQAIEAGASQIVQIDAGGSHRPADACYALTLLDYNDMVIGSRFHPLGRYYGNPNRRRTSMLYSAACNAMTDRNYSDWTSGLRAFRPELIVNMVVQGGMFSAKMHGWQVEVLARAARMDAKIAEIGITYHSGRSSLDLGAALEAARVLGGLRHA